MYNRHEGEYKDTVFPLEMDGGKLFKKIRVWPLGIGHTPGDDPTPKSMRIGQTGHHSFFFFFCYFTEDMKLVGTDLAGVGGEYD